MVAGRALDAGVIVDVAVVLAIAAFASSEARTFSLVNDLLLVSLTSISPRVGLLILTWIGPTWGLLAKGWIED